MILFETWGEDIRYMINVSCDKTTTPKMSIWWGNKLMSYRKITEEMKNKSLINSPFVFVMTLIWVHNSCLIRTKMTIPWHLSNQSCITNGRQNLIKPRTYVKSKNWRQVWLKTVVICDNKMWLHVLYDECQPGKNNHPTNLNNGQL